MRKGNNGNGFKKGHPIYYRTVKANSGSFKKGHPRYNLKNPPSHLGKKRSLETRMKISLAVRGEKSGNWKGGIWAKNLGERGRIEYKLWREAVFKRDNYICQFCGERGGILNADHIKPFAYFPELRFSIDNGRTLCVDCHRKTDTYGWQLYNKKL